MRGEQTTGSGNFRGKRKGWDICGNFKTMGNYRNVEDSFNKNHTLYFKKRICAFFKFSNFFQEKMENFKNFKDIKFFKESQEFQGRCELGLFLKFIQINRWSETIIKISSIFILLHYTQLKKYKFSDAKSYIIKVLQSQDKERMKILNDSHQYQRSHTKKSANATVRKNIIFFLYINSTECWVNKYSKVN